MKKIVVYPDESLRRVSKPILEFGSALDQIVDDMTWTMRTLCNSGLGISAIQVEEPLRIGILERNYGQKKLGKPQIICNPEIIETEGLENSQEGCLSFPGKFINVERPTLVRLKYFDVQGREKYEFFINIWARCILHEIDHMNGILFIDKEKKE